MTRDDSMPAGGRPLSGIRVLDLGRYYQAPYAAHLLAMAGADVIKIEEVGGEPMRRPARDGHRASYAQAMLNSCKRAITLNLKHARGKELLLGLCRSADVLVENFAPGVMDRLGVGFQVLREVNPRLIYASGTGFGLSGPNSENLGMDAVIQAVGGITAVTGDAGGPPLKAGPAVADFLGGTHLYGGIVTALYARERTGKGELVEVALQEAVYPALASNLATAHYRGLDAVRLGNRNSVIAPYNVYEARDGHVAILCTTDDQFRRLAQAMGRPELADDERFARNKARMQNLAETDAVVESWTRAHTREEVFEAARQGGVVAAPVRTLDEVMRDEHMHARGMLAWIDHPDLGRIVVPRSPIRHEDEPQMPLRPSPGLGEHNAEVYGELGLGPAELAALASDGVI